LSVLLGLDVGARRIGVAVGDARNRQVRPLTTFRRGTPAQDAERISQLAREHGVAELVVGLPFHANGREGDQARDTRAWAEAVRPHLELPVLWQDEQHTSQRAEARLRAPRRGRSGGPPSTTSLRAYRARVDREAAALILEAELEARASRPTPAGDAVTGTR
jgi:putative Holliday junction resolvase